MTTTIELLPGDSIDHAARLLTQNAPARCTFNGIHIRARSRRAKPSDIVTGWRRRMDAACAAWSPERTKRREEAEADRAAKQATMDRLVRVLAVLPMDSPGSVLAWVREACGPADRIGVEWDRDMVRAHFAAHGWLPGVNCGEAFDGTDARNFAGWIVGQWLDSAWPGVAMFVDQWSERFGAAS